jgi:hypothetical protein
MFTEQAVSWSILALLCSNLRFLSPLIYIWWLWSWWCSGPNDVSKITTPAPKLDIIVFSNDVQLTAILCKFLEQNLRSTCRTILFCVINENTEEEGVELSRNWWKYDVLKKAYYCSVGGVFQCQSFHITCPQNGFRSYKLRIQFLLLF